MTARTPMLRQYFEIKQQNPEALLAMRVGDFYEFYGEDAELAASAAEITLTGREDGENGRIPMAGVPFHSVEKYLAKLVHKGFRVALCDQLEDPRQAKGLVKRGITRVLTPGSLLDDSMLSPEQNNYLTAICNLGGRIGLASLDPSTGEFAVTEIPEGSAERLIQELARIRPSELLVTPELEEFAPWKESGLATALTPQKAASPDRAERALMRQFQVSSLEGFGFDGQTSGQVAASMILSYAEKIKLSLSHVHSISTYSTDSFMHLDLATRRSLELTTNLSDGSRRMTLLEVLDSTVTPMGSRLLRNWIQQPLISIEPIKKRLEAVRKVKAQTLARADLREALKRFSDLERLVSRVAANLAGPRDLAALRNSLIALPALQEALHLVAVGRLAELKQSLGDHSMLARELDKALVQDPPHSVREGGIFRANFDRELDELRELSKSGKGYIASLEKAEREASGIATLKVGYNAVFGYYLEVPKSQVEKVPQNYIRKQTTANSERYITAELKEHESRVLGAEEKALALENDLFNRLRTRIAGDSNTLLQTARAIAEIDVLSNLAEVALRSGYVEPELAEEDVFEVEGGRHPVVEASRNGFVPNDVSFTADSRVIVLTGPNMSGKSTYLRQVALICLMAQIGSFVPATSCRIGLVDRVFARIGARDELALGQSTFMVEMAESANILNHASRNSVVILDEIGRGTSTFDGLAIAWAITEYLAAIGAKTMFATHYHQMNQLAAQAKGVANYRVDVEEIGDDIVWTHKVVSGGADRSYGIHVARMAGIPRSVLERSQELLKEFENRSDAPEARIPVTQQVQLKLFEAESPEVVRRLGELDVNQLTPLQALALLDEWKRKYTP
ncbi:MAG: DNA mismatch repair protein MutS [Armatimonadetes bacterium]|nr:DNA mismatch repair protein MutS [Armatimonadota bacterium]